MVLSSLRFVPVCSHYHLTLTDCNRLQSYLLILSRILAAPLQDVVSLPLNSATATTAVNNNYKYLTVGLVVSIERRSEIATAVNF